MFRLNVSENKVSTETSQLPGWKVILETGLSSVFIYYVMPVIAVSTFLARKQK